MSKFTNHRAISFFFCRAYFPPVYWARHKTHAEPKVGRSQNGTASNRANLPQSSLKFGFSSTGRDKRPFPLKATYSRQSCQAHPETLTLFRVECAARMDGFCFEARPMTRRRAPCIN